MKLYELTESYAQLSEIQEEGGDVVEALGMIEDAIEEKVGNTLKVIEQMEGEAKLLKQAEERMAERRKSKESEAKRLREYIALQMSKANIKNVKTDTHSVSVRTVKSLVVDPLALIPDEYMVEKPATLSPDKRALMNAIKEGKHFVGVTVDEKASITIR
jgi:hypothetical protein